MINNIDSNISSSKRVEYYDVCKGIAAFCVILQHFININHTYLQENILFSILQYFHMPVFFFISGYFGKSSIKNKSFKILLKEKFRRLVIPFFSWSALSICLKCLLLLKNGEFMFRTCLFQIVKVIIYAESVWYFIAAFFCFILAKLMFIITKENRFLIFIGCIIIMLIPVKINFLVIYKIQELFIFFILGIFISNTLIDSIRNFSKRHFLSVFMVGCVLLIPLSKAYYVSVDSWIYFIIIQVIFDLCGLLFVTTIISEIVGRISILKNIMNNFGKHSMELYCIHMPFLQLTPINLILKIRGTAPYIHYLYYILYAYAVAIFCWGISVAFLNKIKIYRMLLLGERLEKHV